WLPGCYQPNRRWSPPTTAPRRADHGLPEDGFVFASFNQSYKITPEMFDCWGDMLRRVERSVLWIWSEEEDGRANLRERARSAGIDPARLVFTGRVAPAVHLARLSCADLMLDTLPCNAHTTASDALHAGLPILTLQGRSFAARVAASLLTAVGLP